MGYMGAPAGALIVVIAVACACAVFLGGRCLHRAWRRRRLRRMTRRLGARPVAALDGRIGDGRLEQWERREWAQITARLGGGQ